MRGRLEVRSGLRRGHPTAGHTTKRTDPQARLNSTIKALRQPTLSMYAVLPVCTTMALTGTGRYRPTPYT